MMHSIFWISLAAFALLLTLQVCNWLFGTGQPVYILFQLGGFGFMGLWMFLWRYSKLNMPKCLIMYLLVHGVISSMIFWDMLGPFNVPSEVKGSFNEHLLLNFIICTVVCVNSLQFSALMCLTFVLCSLAGLLGQCNNPFPGVQEVIEHKGCAPFVQELIAKRISFALHIFVAHYM